MQQWRMKENATFCSIACAFVEYEALSSFDTIWICSAFQEGLQPFNSVDAVDVFHFDFMKNLPPCKLTVSGGSSF